MKDQARPHDFRAIGFRLDIYYRYAARHMRWLNWRIVQIWDDPEFVAGMEQAQREHDAGEFRPFRRAMRDDR